MLSSLEDDLSELVLCSICIELLSDTRVLGCGHTFCLGCLQRYGSRKRPGDRLPCPMCRSDFEVPGGGFADLPRNFLLEKILEIHANALAGLDCCAPAAEKEHFREQSRSQNQSTTTSERQLVQDDDNRVTNNMQQQQQQRQPNQRYEQQPVTQRRNAVQRHQGVVEQQEQPQEQALVQPQRQQLEHPEQQQQQQQQQQPDLDQRQQEQRRERRRQQLQQRHQQRQLELQLQRQLEQQEQQRRWQFYRQRRRLSGLSCGCWSTRIIVLSTALNFILAGSLWQLTERFEENETDWLNKSTIYRMKINELIDEDAKKKDIIASSELNCENRVFLTVQRCEQDIKFYQSYIRTLTSVLETVGRPKDPTFNIIN